MAVRTVADQLARAVAEFGPHPALLTPDGWLSFDQLGTLAGVAAGLLGDEGASRGDRIVLALENSAVLRVLEHAVLRFGMVRVALSPRLHPREVAAIAADCAAPLVCVAPDTAATVRDALRAAGSTARVLEFSDSGAGHTPARLAARSATADPEPAVAPDDMAMLMYSSGTTGEPKGAVITHGAWVAQTRNALGELPPVGPGDVVLAAAPMSHFGGTIGLNCAVSGAATVPMRAFDPRAVITAIRDHSVTVLPLVPVLLTRLTNAMTAEDRLVPPLRAVPYGGSPIAPDALARAAERLPGVLHQFYGLAEALAPLSCLPPGDHDAAARAFRANANANEREWARKRLQSCGRWIDAVEARIEDGQVLVRGEVVMPGYWNRPELTARVRTADGWFATGDLAEAENDGYIRLVDRMNDVIISGGFNVYPGEVERAIATVDGVEEVVVLGLPDERWGEGVHAAVVLRDDVVPPSVAGSQALLAAVTEACKSRLASYKKPLRVHVVQAIPRNAMGKVDRRALRAQLLLASTQT